ncbi:uncharacterized protein BDW70DRAFT_138651 [Aspergillus foveolatus]|uniref:uncharacterized protein n=1 Tax=Aspergillus foveolatus TaxID=210207 RepID=UPI003CCDC367
MLLYCLIIGTHFLAELVVSLDSPPTQSAVCPLANPANKTGVDADHDNSNPESSTCHRKSNAGFESAQFFFFFSCPTRKK